MEKHSQNALELAKYLKSHPKVDFIIYPGLEGDKYYDLGKKYLPKGASAVLSFGVKGGREAGEKLLEKLQLASIVVHVGDIRTSVLHPASTTHRQMTEEQQKEAGLDPALIRVSVGLESIEDIIADFEQALEQI
jgi:O-acetylhomoserine (thiol)-lyase